MFDDHDEYQMVRLAISSLIAAGISATSAYTTPYKLVEESVAVADALLAECGFLDPDQVSS